MQVQFIDGIFYVIVLIISIVIHEFSHGYSAYLLGDDTARHQGRLTLNPLKHLDPFGSVILPLLLIISNTGFVIGWAKPVPYNPANLKKGKWSNVIVAFSGIAANLLMAIIFGIMVNLAPIFGLPEYTYNFYLSLFQNIHLMHPFYAISTFIILLNLILALFNIIPIPPLDGSKILFSFIPPQFRYIENFLEKCGMFVLLFFIIFLWKYVSPLIYIAFSFLTGMSL
jgi:Zn-dependent protease